MNSVAKNIFRALHEGKWLYVEYKNQRGAFSRFWIGIKSMLFFGPPENLFCTIQCKGLHLGDYTLADDMRLEFSRICSAQIVDGTYMPVNKDALDDIDLHPAKYQAVFDGAANLKILNYLSDCNKMEGAPSINKDFHLVQTLDDETLQSQGGDYALDETQFRTLVDAFHKENRARQHFGAREANQLCINKLGVYTKQGLYVLAYREVLFDVTNRTLKPSGKISFNGEFCVDVKSKKIESIRKFIAAEDAYLLDDFESNIQEIEDLIQKRSANAKIDDRPYFLCLARNCNVDLEKEYEAIFEMYDKGKASVPIKAFFGELHESKKNAEPCPLALLNNNLNLDQLLSIYNAMNYPVSYVQGPPGTGKTSTIVNAILSAFFNGKTVLFSSYNNHPIDGVFQTLASLRYKRRDGADCTIPFPILRLGNSEKVKEAVAHINSLYKICKDIPVYRSTLLRDKGDKIERTKKLVALLELHKEALELGERKNTLEAMLSKGVSMEMRLVLEGQQLSAIKKREAEIPKIDDADALALLENDKDDFMKYLYFTSASYIKRLAEPEYNELRSILAMNDEDKRAAAFNKYTSFDENLVLLQKLFPVIATTCISSHRLGSGKARFDITIIDEASQCDTATALVPIMRGDALMLVGDTQQLNPVITLDKTINAALKEKYGVSDDYDYISNSIYKTFLANDSVSEEILLRNHYRCAKDIIEFNNKKYYNEKLNVLSQRRFAEPLVFCDVNETRTTVKNTAPQEAKEIVRYIKQNPEKKIGIITPFRNQKELIEYSLKEAGVPPGAYSCGTVHAFQGDEKDVVLFSLALGEATRQKTYEWLKNNRELINVATSRAKDKLVIFSNGKALETLHRRSDKEKGDDIYELANYVKANGAYKITPRENNSRALGTKPYKTETEEEFLTTLNHALSNIISENKRYSVETEVQASHIFEKDKSNSDYFYRCSFDFVVYQIGFRGKKMPLLAIELNGREHYENEAVKARDAVKKKICRDQGFTLIEVRNSYARRYNFIKEILSGYFAGKAEY